ncbi:reverse transcriptase domain-containing protein [Tanacetum coccineum]
MLLTRLFDFIIGENPELKNESYVLYDRVMNPLAAQLERKPKMDRGTRRGRLVGTEKRSIHHNSSSLPFDSTSPLYDICLKRCDDDGNMTHDGVLLAERAARLGEAKTWLDELNEGTIESLDELCTTFISRFFPPALSDRLLGEIRAFSKHEHETLTDVWLRMKEMLRNCHGHNLTKGNIIKIFYHGLNKTTQEALNAATGGIFLYKTPNQAYQLLEDKVLLKHDWAKNQKPKISLKKTVAFTEEGSNNSDTNKIMARMDVMTMKMDAHVFIQQTGMSYPNSLNTAYRSPVAMTKVIKEEFKKLELFEIDEDLFTYDTQLGMIINEFNRLSRINDDLFACEIEVPKPTHTFKSYPYANGLYQTYGEDL